MNIYTVSEYDKEKLVTNAIKMYKDSLLLLNDDSGRINENMGVYSCLSMKDKVEHILEGLRLEYAYIIRREYMESSVGNYYQQYFSEEEYIMYKKGAIDSFLHCLYGDALL